MKCILYKKLQFNVKQLDIHMRFEFFKNNFMQ